MAYDPDKDVSAAEQELIVMSGDKGTDKAVVSFIYELLCGSGVGQTMADVEDTLQAVVTLFNHAVEEIENGWPGKAGIGLPNGYAADYAESILTRLNAAEERLQAAKKLREAKKTEAPVAAQQQLHTWYMPVANEIFVGGGGVLACEPEKGPEFVVTKDATEKADTPSTLLLFSDQATTAAKTLMGSMRAVLAEEGLKAETFSALLSSDVTSDALVIQLIVPKLSAEAIKAASQVTVPENLPVDPTIDPEIPAKDLPRSALPVADQKTFLIQMLLRQFSLAECGDPRVQDFLDKMTQQEVHGKEAEELYTCILGATQGQLKSWLYTTFKCPDSTVSRRYTALRLYAEAYLHTYICKFDLLPLLFSKDASGACEMVAGVAAIFNEDFDHDSATSVHSNLLTVLCNRVKFQSLAMTPEKHKELYFRASENFGGIDWLLVFMRKTYLAECVHCRLSGQEMPGGLASEEDEAKLNLFVCDFIENNL